MESVVKKMLEIWISRNGCCTVSSYNFIKDEGEGNYSVSVMETDKEDSVWLCLYDVYIGEESFKIVERK